MRYSRWAALGMVLAATVATGCGSDNEDGTSSAASTTPTAKDPASGGKPVKAAWLTYTYTDYNKADEKGLKAVLEPSGGSVTVFNANFNPQKLIQQCQDAISSGRYNAILLAPVDAESGKPCVTAAKAAKIPVFNFEITIGDPTKITPQVDGVEGAVVGSITANAANRAELTAKACKGLDVCEIIQELAFPSDPYSVATTKAIEAQVPNAKIVQKIVGQYDPSLVAKAFPDALSAHPGTDVFVASSDQTALAVLPALKQAGKVGDVKLLGAGGSRLGAKGVKDGTLFGTVGNWPDQAAKAVAKMMVQSVNGEPVEPNGVDMFAIDEPAVLTKDNIDDFTPEWGA